MYPQVSESDVEVSESEVGHPRIILVQTNVFRTGLPDKLPHPSSGTRFALQTREFRASAISKNAFRARPSKTESGRCDNKAFLSRKTSFKFRQLKM
jgi:hypothetical protein